MNTIKTSIATLTLIADEIIHVVIDDFAEFGLEELMEMRELNKELANGKDYCLLLETGDMSTFSKEAMSASVTPEHSVRRIALAILENNLATTILANFYLNTFRSSNNTKAFKSKEKALEWLKAKREEHYK